VAARNFHVANEAIQYFTRKYSYCVKRVCPAEGKKKESSQPIFEKAYIVKTRV
jgi:hypothetical protein